MGKSNKHIGITKLQLTLIVLCTIIGSLFPLATSKAQEEENYFFELDLIYTPQHSDIVEFVAESWAEIGIKTNLISMEWGECISRMWYGGTFSGATYKEGGNDLCYGSWGMNMYSPDHSFVWHSASFHPAWNNIGFFDNGTVDRLLEEVREELDYEKQKEIISKVQKILKQEQPFIFMWNMPGVQTLDARPDHEIIGFHFPVWRNYIWNTSIKGKTYEDDTTFILSSEANPDTLFAHFTVMGMAYYVFDCILDSLIYYDLDGNVIPCLAESWTLSEDDRTWTFKLREDVNWHDGEKFDANDVKFTADMIMNPAVGSVDNKLWTDQVKEVRIIDDYTIEFETYNPWSDFLPQIGMSYIIPEHIFTDVNPEDYKTHPYGSAPIGTGPYKFVKWEQDDYVELAAYEDYHIQRPFIDHLFIKIITDPATALAALENHEIDGILRFVDIVMDNIERLEADPTIKIVPFNVDRTYMFFMNNRHPQLAYKWVRRAMIHAIDRESYIQEVFKGYTKAAYSTYASGNIFHDPNIKPYEYDVELAKQYMEKAGFNYEWLEPETLEIPMQTYLVSGAGGFIIGCVVAAIATWVFMRRK